jgi:hypothetical protein
MLAFCTSPSEISLVLGPSDARWLSEEMSFLAELYSSKADSSRRQFGEDHNAALASFWETALKCRRLSVALQQAVSRGQRWEDTERDQHIDALPAIDPPQQALVSSSPANSSASAERQTRPKRARGTAKGRAAKKKKVPSPPSGR